MSNWKNYNLTEKEASDINRLHIQSSFESFPRKLNKSSHLGSCETSDTHDDRGSDYSSDGGWILATKIWGGALYPLPSSLSKKDTPEGEIQETTYQKSRTEEASWFRC